MPTLISNPDKHFYIRDEVYEGVVDPIKVNVVQVNDMVLDWNQGLMRVDSLNINMKPDLVIWNPVENVDIGDESVGLITGLSTYQPSVINRAFYHQDISTRDWVVLDSRFRVYGVDVGRCKLFFGTDTSANGQVISVNLSPPPVDSIALVSAGTNQYVVPPIPVQFILNEGELVTLVVYSNDIINGVVINETTFRVKPSSAVAPPAMNSGAKVINDITLISTYINLDPDVLEIPVNLGMQFNVAQARLHYTDATTLAIPINGVKCKLLGMENFNNNMAGAKSYLTLVYYPDNNEYFINGNSNGNITRIYEVHTVAIDPADFYKVYLSVNYNPLTQMFGFKFYLTHVDYREPLLLEPGQYSVLDQNGNAINLSRTWHLNNGPVNMVIKVNMEAVYPETYDQFIFTQQLYIDLNDVTGYSSTWFIDYEMDNLGKLNGIYKFKTNISNNYEDLDMKAGAVDLAEWLERLYDPIVPIFEPPALVAPTPTHFRLKYENGLVNYVSPNIPVSQWNIVFNPGTHIWADKGTVDIHWLEDTGSEFLVLGITPVMIIAVYT